MELVSNTLSLERSASFGLCARACFASRQHGLRNDAVLYGRLLRLIADRPFQYCGPTCSKSCGKPRCDNGWNKYASGNYVERCKHCQFPACVDCGYKYRGNTHSRQMDSKRCLALS